MYPNLYYVFKDWFGVEWPALGLLNTFGLLVAISFFAAAWTLHAELKRMEKLGWMSYREEWVLVGAPASAVELITQGLLGFLFGYKVFGVLLSLPPGMPAREYLLSTQGHWPAGLIAAAVMAGLKWWERNKVRLAAPERRNIRIWPHDRVGDMVILALVFGILGAKLFDNFEHWDEFIADPIGRLFSQSGLTFYGGLILAAIAICLFAYRKGIPVRHLVDAAAPGLMLAYAVGRLGCQISGDGDWGVYNSAYVCDETGQVHRAAPGAFDSVLHRHSTYFLQGSVEEEGRQVYVTDRSYPSLDQVPARYIPAPSFLPDGLVAYGYPGNVNRDGIPMPGNTDEHNRMLPAPVLPTPLYEAIIGSLLFGLMWMVRRRLTRPRMMFGLYLVLNGLERWFIETIRVNTPYNVLGIETTQAQFIALLLVLSGISLMAYAASRPKATPVSP